MASSAGLAYANRLIDLRCQVPMPTGFQVLYPYSDLEVQRVVRQFYQQYLTDGPPRLALWGINPGRFGAGITGIAFTDPWALNHQLGIGTTLEGRREPSAIFISAVIDAYGGPAAFYADVLLTALSPLGFTREGVNVNFYDDAALQRTIVPFVVDHIAAVHSSGASGARSILLGSGKLQQFVNRHLIPINALAQTVALDHPRYIMQYRRLAMAEYVRSYVDAIRTAVEQIRCGYG
jgi:hypothetical protein